MFKWMERQLTILAVEKEHQYEERVFSRLRFRICVLVFIYLNNK